MRNKKNDHMLLNWNCYVKQKENVWDEASKASYDQRDKKTFTGTKSIGILIFLYAWICCEILWWISMFEFHKHILISHSLLEISSFIWISCLKIFKIENFLQDELTVKISRCMPSTSISQLQTKAQRLWIFFCTTFSS